MSTHTVNDSIDWLANAIREACAEHGRDNSFGCKELKQYGGPDASMAGKIGRSEDYTARLHRRLGGDTWGSAPRYDVASRRWITS